MSVFPCELTGLVFVFVGYPCFDVSARLADVTVEALQQTHRDGTN